MRKNTIGFTIVELIIVIVVIGILAAITIVSYSSAQGRSRDTQRQTDIQNIAKALELYYADNGYYPLPTAPGSTPSIINASWYSSPDASWAAFANDLTGNIDNLPTDPSNPSRAPWAAGGYSYAYYTGGYCGNTRGQWYLLVYRLETKPKEQETVGDCTTNPLGESYFNAGASFYRFVR